MAGFLVPLAKAYLIDKALEKAGVPEGLPRSVLSGGITGGARGAVKPLAKAAVRRAIKEMQQDDEPAIEMLADEKDTYPENDVQAFKRGGKVKSNAQRGDGIAKRGKTKGRFV